MGKTVLCGAFLLLAVLALGVGGAGGRELATTTVVVEVIGGGSVADSGGQIGCGNESTDCYATYVSGNSVTLTATGNTAWTFASWGGCSSVSTSTCTVTLDGSTTPHTITATFNPVGSPPGDSTLTVSPMEDASGNGGEVTGGTNREIDCGSSGTHCSWTAITGSTLTVLETPDSGYSFDGWGGDCGGSDPSCSVSMDGDANITATFVKASSTNTLSVTVTGNGIVSGGGISCTSAAGSTCSVDEAANTQVTLTATPGSGAGFTGWGGACAGTTTTCVVTMDSSKSVTASFSGGGQPPPSGTFALVVAVSGNGEITGGGIDCGNGATQCSQNETSGSSILLRATPAAGAKFSGWGGACSGSASTCTVTMTRAQNVSATFAGGASKGTVKLSVAVTGPGTVTGGGITCGHGEKACSVEEQRGASITLTAAAAEGGRFVRWGGACSGSVATCNLTVSAATSVSALFEVSGAPPPPPKSGVVLRSTGKPVVKRTSAGYTVTLRFRASRHGRVHVQALRAGRIEAAFAFSVAAGRVTAGPFPLGAPGFYLFQVTLAGGSLHWTACLGVCGDEAASGPFTLVRQAPVIVRSGVLWSLQLRFQSSEAAGVDLRVFRRGALARDVRFPVDAGRVDAKPLLLSPGSYSLRLYATDAYGRLRKLTWLAILG